MAEDVRVQIRKHHQTTVKKGKYEKHLVELGEVSQRCRDQCWKSEMISVSFRKLSKKHITEVNKILAQTKEATGSK